MTSIQAIHPASKVYVLAQNPGLADAVQLREFYGTEKAYRAATELEREYPQFTFDVMKKLPDGTLTTEF